METSNDLAQGVGDDGVTSGSLRSRREIALMELKPLGVDSLDIEKLDLSRRKLTSIPDDIGQLLNLTHLYLDGNALTSIPDAIGRLSNLKELWLNDNLLWSIPASIGRLSNLRELRLNDNLLTNIPANVGELSNLTGLWVNGNELSYIPDEIGRLSQLLELELSDNPLTYIPDEIIARFSKLRNLVVEENPLRSLLEGEVAPESHSDDPDTVSGYSRRSFNTLWNKYHPKFKKATKAGWEVAPPVLNYILGEIYRRYSRVKKKDDAIWMIAQLQELFYKTVKGLNEKKRQYIMSGSPISLESVMTLELMSGSSGSSLEHGELNEEHITKVMKWWKPDFTLEEVECEERDRLGAGHYGSVYPFKWEGVECAIKIWSFDRTSKNKEEDEGTSEKEEGYEGTPKMKDGTSYASREHHDYLEGEKEEMVELHSAKSKTEIDDAEQKEQIERIKQVLEIGAMVFLQTFLPEEVTDHVIELKGVVKTRDGKIGVVMEKASMSLKDWIVENEGKNVGLKTRLSIVHQIAWCLELLHGGFALQILGQFPWEGSVVHGDLHFGNVLLMEGSEEDAAEGITVKLCDFGLCKILTKKQPSLKLKRAALTHGLTHGLTHNKDLPGIGFSRSQDVNCFGILMYQVLAMKETRAKDPKEEVVDNLSSEVELSPSLSDMVRRCLRDKNDGVRMEDVRAELEDIDGIAKEWEDWLEEAQEKARERKKDEREKLIRELKGLETMNDKGEWLKGRIPETEEKPYLMDVVDIAARSGDENEFLVSLGRIDPSGEGPEDWFSPGWEEDWEDEKEYFWGDFRGMERPLEARIFEFVHVWDLQTEDILEEVEELFGCL